MRTRLVSFLGLGPHSEPPHYLPAIYELDGRRSTRTALIEVAVKEVVEGIESIVVFGTEQVEQRWFETGLFEQMVGQAPWFRLVPQGATEQERWELFDHVREALSNEALEEAGEASRPEQIILDVTHGFRSQPVFAMAAVSYVLSEWNRLALDDPPALRIIYGAWENRDRETEVAPIWDLTELVVASQWNAALDAFLRFGRADDLARLGAQEAKLRVEQARARGVQGKALAEASFPKSLGKAAKALADDLALARVRDVLAGSGHARGSAAALRDKLGSEHAAAFAARFPPVRAPFDRLRDRLEPLSAPALHSPAGVVAATHLSGFYGHLQRFSEQSALVRETLLTLHGVVTGQETPPEPGESGCPRGRRELEDRLNDLAQRLRHGSGDAVPAESKAIGELWNWHVSARNDIQHCGFNDQPAPASSLREQLRRTQGRLEALARPATDRPHDAAPEAAAPDAPRPCHFLNLSNHPLAQWTAPQREAAAKLGLGEPVDLEDGMPLIDPEADTTEIERLADHVARRALDQGAAGAFVAGEPAFSAALVRRLQSAGVRCFTATTTREADSALPRGDTVIKRSTFRFVRWREYPWLGGDHVEPSPQEAR